MLEAKGRVVLVTGASRGIGAAAVQRLLAAGFIVSAGARRPDAVPPRAGLEVHRYDAEDAESARDWVAAVAARHGRIDALVNAAGINTMATLQDEDDAALDELWRVNVKGPRRLIRLSWPHLVAAGHGRVVNLASMSGKRVRNGNLGYAMSKFALVALTHAVRREGWEHGIRATALCPSFVATGMTHHVTSVARERMTQPADLAALIETCLLLPDEAVVAELLVNCRLEDML